MEGSGRPSPFGPGRISGSSHSLHAANHDRHREHHQEQSYSLTRHLAPAPTFLPNQPALWQLGWHPIYTPGDEHTRGSTDAHEDSSNPPTTQAADHQKDVKQVSHDLGDTNEAQLRDVEEELHRGLKARQVRHKHIDDEIPLNWFLFQVSMVALGGAIGIGLVIGTGMTLKQGWQ
jgi:hypothetical protein